MNPQLPPELTRLDMRLRYRGYTLDLRITRDRGLVSVREAGDLPIRLLVCHREHELTDGDWLEFALES